MGWEFTNFHDDRNLGGDASDDASSGRQDREGFERDGIDVGDSFFDGADVKIVDLSVQEVIV